ncbi:MAG: molybdopterin-guanine dinucleotide biosynthesis protein A [Enterobacterales bacterium]
MKTIGVVLAGGLSTRMLEDKAELIWKQKSLLEHTEHLLKDAGCFEVIVSNNINPKHIQDRYPKSGPLAGIDACLAYILEHFTDVSSMLLMPVDMPLMTQSLLGQLIEKSEQDKAAYYSLGRFPLILPVSKKLSKILKDTLEKHQSGKGVSIKQLLSHLENKVLDIDKDQQTAFFNCNTPEQWRSLLPK